jgi:integral membrane protein
VSTHQSRTGKPKEIRSALSVYRTMAVIAGIALFVLIAEMIMKYVFKQDNFLTRNWSYIHGFIYIGYAASVGNLGIKCGWRLWRIVKNLLAGFVPVVPWVAEQRNAKEINALLERDHVGGAAGDASTAGADAGA